MNDIVRKSAGPANGGGSRKGIPNKTTQKAREAFAVFVEGNASKMQEWLEAVATDPRYGPKTAFELLLAVSEYHIPKLARTEMVGDKEQPIVHVYKWEDE